jgi:hypothetical protein
VHQLEVSLANVEVGQGRGTVYRAERTADIVERR